MELKIEAKYLVGVIILLEYDSALLNEIVAI